MENMMEKRITVEEVIEAYKETGLKPKRGRYFQDFKLVDRENYRYIPQCACGMGAIYAYNKKNEANYDSQINQILFIDELYSSSYRCGFANGFDGVESQEKYHKYKRYGLGYEDGQKAYQAVVDLGMVE
jgi:hypothetical protein